MGVATAQATVGGALNSVDNTERSLILRGTVAFSAVTDTYAAGGLVMTFANYDPIKSSGPATQIKIWSQTGTATPNTTLFLYSYQPGTTAANGKVQIWEQSGADDTPLDEFDDTVAITAPFADVLLFEAVFPRV